MSADRIKRGLEAFIRSTMSRVDYYALYPAKVVAQAVDGSLELKPDDVRIAPLSRVKVRLGLPGVSVKVAAGSRVLLGYEGGNPAAPVATLWEVSSLLELTITATTKVTVSAPDVRLGDGTAKVLREGDVLAFAVGLVAGPNPVTGAAAVSITGGTPTKVKA